MPGLIRGVARTAVVAGTASAVAGRVHHRQQGRWAAQEQAAAAQQQPAQYAPEPAQYAPEPAQYAEPPAASGTDDKLAQLKQLGELRDAGVLTDAEFEAQKGKILYA
jgi:Short C-terminal domain